MSSNLVRGEVYSIQHYVIKVCQWLATGRWFSPGTQVSTTNKTDRNEIAEILLKVALNTINQTKPNHHSSGWRSISLLGTFPNKLIFQDIWPHRWCNGERARNQRDNVYGWVDISIRGLLFQWASTIKIKLNRVGLVQSWHHLRIEN